MGISTSRLCDRRAYRGRIDGEYRMRAPSVASRSRTRGWRTATGPMPVMISRSGRWPWRTTRCWPVSVLRSVCFARNSATSASTAWVSSARAPLRRISVRQSVKAPGWASLMTLLSDTAYHSFIGEVEALNTTTIRRLTRSPRHQLLAITLHLLVDSTGLKLSGAGEWLVEKHGTSRRRSWRKLHIGVDADTERVVAAALTTNDVDDGSQVGPLLDQIDGPIASFTADGAYDQDGVYGEVAARHPEAAVIVPPRSSAVPSETADTAPTPRDRHLQAIAEHGRMSWQKTAGYNWRALVEADIGRWKRVIGHALRSQTDKRQATEVALAVDVLNRMLALGRPSYVRIV